MNQEEMLDRQKHIRNFSIIAHIDHGKSTLADRILELTDTIAKRDMQAQVLDDMALERERGITIKLNAVELHYKAKNGETYIFHLIDTPGHVDFSYEVSRSLAACEGALLVVDATQGVEAQTLANVYLAIDDDLEIIPVINKVDLPSAQPDVVKEEIEEMIGLDASDAILASGKTGLGVPEILERIVTDVPAPSGDLNAPLQALIFDSVYDDYRGVVLDVRVKEGQVKVGDTIQLMSNGKQFQVTEVGVMSPKAVKRDFLMVGDVGYITAAIKTIQDTRVGDTVTLADRPAEKPLKGYRKITPMVYSGLFPVDNAKFNDLREALEKLQLNDADYEIIMTDGTEKTIDNPADMPEVSEIKEIREPYVKASIMVPNDYVGPVMELSQRKRGEFVTMDYLDKYRVNVIYNLPLSEIIYDFFDDLKSSTKGYASLDYEITGYRQSDLVKMDILLNGDPVDALSTIVHKDFAYERGKAIVARLKTTIPRQQFEIPIQAAIGNKVIARSTVKAYRKNVLAKCYGGDITRKRKLLEKQKAGKKRMKSVGSVEVPQEAFMSILKMNDEESQGK